MSKYVDVYLAPVPEENIPAYKKMATAAAKVFMKHGALRYREYVISDSNGNGCVEFPKRIKLKEGETLVYAAIEFKSEAQRNKAMKAIMADPELMAACGPDDKPLFDFKRMVYGGFKVLVDVG